MLAIGTLVACAAPPPTPSPSEVAATPPPVSPSSTASPVVRQSPSLTPTPTLTARGIEVFPGGDAGWELVATERQQDDIGRIEVLRAITDTVEIYADCVGQGRLTVTVNASPPAEPPPTEPAPTPYILTTFDVECPGAQGVSFAGSAPAGLFVASDSRRSDPSIRYQVLIATPRT